MAIKLIKREWQSGDDYHCEFIMDSAEDAADLPQCCAGSTAIVADKDGAIFMVNASGEWAEF